VETSLARIIQVGAALYQVKADAEKKVGNERERESETVCVAKTFLGKTSQLDLSARKDFAVNHRNVYG
jgi:hypothetical protein